MISINGFYSWASAGKAAVAPASRLGGTTAANTVSGADAAAPQSATVSISAQGSQLAASLDRFQQMQRSLNRDQLAAKAGNTIDQLTGASYEANKAQHNAELPKTSDPALLARAKQATAYVNAAARGSKAESNPFGGLSRETLNAVVYDDSGAYTVNERRAAYYEAYQQEESWRQAAVQKAMDEYHRTGKTTEFHKSALEHFKGLQPIEQAQYPKDYAVQLQNRISMQADTRLPPLQGQAQDGDMRRRMQALLQPLSAGNT